MKRFADLIVTGGSLWSDGVRMPAAGALAVAGGRVAAVGSFADVVGLAGPDTVRIDAAGATVTPGLCDAHIHLVQWARSLGEVDLTGCRDRDEALRRVAGFTAAHPEHRVVIGRGWDANRWSETPDRAALDRVTGGRPALLHSKDFHAAWVNTAALTACGIGPETREPAGGVIRRDAVGQPTGVLQENAVALCAEVAKGSAASDLDAVQAAVARLHAAGITAVHDFEGPAAQRALRSLTRAAEPPLRVLMHLAHAALDAAVEAGITSGVGDEWFRIGAVKLFADGTLGSRTAALLEPYAGTTETGLELLSPAALRDLVGRAVPAGLSVAIHAIGDRAVRNALDAFTSAREHLPALALPPRIEHLQLVRPEDAARLAPLGVAASMQPQHCVSDIELAERHWGARCRDAYPWRGLLDRGALLAFGSDAPVEPPVPALGFAAAVARRGRGGEAFIPAQRLTLDATLAAYTEGAARLAGWWPQVGSLRPGAWADFVVWDADLHALDADRLAAAHPVYTAVAGRIVHGAAAAGHGEERTRGPRSEAHGATTLGRAR